MLIVGIDHTGAARMEEYTPVRDKRHSGGGRAADYERMLIEELKPLIDERFRTLGDAANTGIGGSSLGGLLALHAVLTHRETFGRAAVMSPSVWWSERAILKTAEDFAGEAPRMWVDSGGREGAEALTDARALRDRLVAKGWSDDTLHYFEDRRADHSERAWARRARPMLEFLFPPA